MYISVDGDFVTTCYLVPNGTFGFSFQGEYGLLGDRR